MMMQRSQRMSKSILEKNLEAMEKWYPAFADLIREEHETEDPTNIMVETSWDGETIFRIEQDGRQLYLGGKRNAKEPIQIWSERVGEIHKYAPVFLFGVGSAAYLKAIIEKSSKEVNVVVYEPSIHIFMAMLENIDISKEIEDRPIAFVVKGLNEEEFEPVMRGVMTLENMSFLIEEIHPNYRPFFLEDILEKVKKVQRLVESEMVQFNTQKKLSMNMAQNILRNMKYVCEGYHTKLLLKAVSNKDAAILVAAGPSLNKNIRMLKKAKNRLFILAVDTAVKPLVKAGIKPDAFITIDAKKDLDLVEIDGAETIPVIAPATALYKIMDRQKAKKIFYYDGYFLPYSIYFINDKVLPDVSTGGSVACSGFSLLHKLGYETIILVGQDLAFTDNKSHADGTFEEKMPTMDTEGMEMVKGNYVDKIPTRMDFRIFLNWFQDYIHDIKEANPNIRVVNATAGGAYIEGTEVRALDDIIEEVCKNVPEEINFTERIEALESEFTEEEHKKAVDYLKNVPKDFEDMLKDAKELEKAYQKLGKIGKSGTVEKKGCLKQLKKIKKITTKIEESEEYQLILTCIPIADYIIRSEYYFEGDTIAKETEEIARKGKLYCEVLEECITLLKGLSEETLLPLK